MAPSSCRRSYAESPVLFGRVRALLEVVFPGITETIEKAAPLGLRWEESTPFVREDGERIVTHVGVIEMTLVIAGVEQAVGVIHGVATHPDHRRRGLYRTAITDALSWCDERYETVVLNTGQPELYEPFGFRRLPESRWFMPWKEPAGPGEWRRLDYAEPGDVATMQRLLLERAPVSRRLGVVRETQAFAFNQVSDPPWHSAELDALACMRVAGSTLELFDVVASVVPELLDVVARVGRPIDRVECYFDAADLDERLLSEPHVLMGEDHLMVRGPLACEGEPVMLAHPARC